MNRRHFSSGFTLLELLTIIAVIIILVGVTFWFSRPALIRQRVAEATSQVTQDLERMRSTASKTSRDARMIIDPATPNSYTLRYWNGGARVDTTVNLPNGAQIYFQDERRSLIYTPPYGEFSAVNRTVYINPPGINFNTQNGPYTRPIYIVGVTGKVHQ